MQQPNDTRQHFLNEFTKNYTQIHGKVIFISTIIGLVISLLTNFILRKDHFRTTTNLIVRYIIIFRGIVLISYNIYSFYFHIIEPSNPFMSQSIIRLYFAIFHSNISLTAHSIALWFTCLLAIIRFIIASKPNNESIVAVRHVIRLIIILTCLLLIPNYLTWRIVKVDESFYLITTNNSKSLERNCFVILALYFQILPMSILFVFSFLLRSNFSRSCQSNELPTIQMILFLIYSTISLELPRIIFFAASGIHVDFLNIYSRLGDLWDLTSISTSFLIFLIYFLMSARFRFEIYQILFSRISFDSI